MFEFNVNDIDSNYNFSVFGVSSIIEPKDNTIIFCNEKFFSKYSDNINKVNQSIVIIPLNCEYESKNNLIIKANNSRLEYAKILSKIIKEDNKISKNAVIKDNVEIGENVSVGDFCLIESNSVIGNNTIIKSGCKVLSNTIIGHGCIINENAVLGTMGLAFEKNESNEYVHIPQLGRLVIEDNVYVGASSIIARGAINDTIIKKGCKIDANVFISHNVVLGENCLVVGNTILFGGVNVGNNSYISGGSTIRNQIVIGKNATIGLGSVVVSDIPDNAVVYGNPAKIKKLVK